MGILTALGHCALEAVGRKGKSSGSDLLSRTVSHAVPLAQEGLTAVFGMGTGVAPPPLPPEQYITCVINWEGERVRRRPAIRQSKSFGRLVPVG